jgi:hypothetical protein
MVFSIYRSDFGALALSEVELDGSIRRAKGSLNLRWSWAFERPRYSVPSLGQQKAQENERCQSAFYGAFWSVKIRQEY